MLGELNVSVLGFCCCRPAVAARLKMAAGHRMHCNGERERDGRADSRTERERRPDDTQVLNP